MWTMWISTLTLTITHPGDCYLYQLVCGWSTPHHNTSSRILWGILPATVASLPVGQHSEIAGGALVFQVWIWTQLLLSPRHHLLSQVRNRAVTGQLWRLFCLNLSLHNSSLMKSHTKSLRKFSMTLWHHDQLLDSWSCKRLYILHLLLSSHLGFLVHLTMSKVKPGQDIIYIGARFQLLKGILCPPEVQHLNTVYMITKVWDHPNNSLHWCMSLFWNIRLLQACICSTGTILKTFITIYDNIWDWFCQWKRWWGLGYYDVTILMVADF